MSKITGTEGNITFTNSLGKEITYTGSFSFELSGGSEPRKHWSSDEPISREGQPRTDILPGAICYVKENVYHRVDGPSITYDDGSTEWHFEGKRHRTDGPAIDNVNGSKEYWIDGEEVAAQCTEWTAMLNRCGKYEC